MTEQTTLIEPAAEAPADIAALPPATRATIVLSSSKTEVDLRALVTEAQGITAVKDKAGREQAHRIGMRLKTARTTIEKTGKSAREDAQAFVKAVLDEEKRLKAITAAEEDRIFKLRDEFDAEQRRIEEERAAAEAKRVAEIREKIAGIRGLPLALAGAGSEEIAAEREALAAFTPPPEVFAEFTEECQTALREAIAALDDLHARVKGQEAAAALVEAERQRLADAQREADERIAAERERAAEAQRQADEAVAAERARAEAAERELAALRAQIAAAQTAPAPEAPPDEPITFDTAVTDVWPAPVATAIGIDPAPAGSDETVEVTLRVPTEVAQAVEADPAGAVEVLQATAASWNIRQAALATADQFSALAQKVQACGFGSFANELLAVADLLRNGDHDSALAAADVSTLIAADNAMIDASVQCVEALAEQREAA